MHKIEEIEKALNLLETGQKMSDQYAHRWCKFAGIKSKSKHYAYKKPGEKGR